MPGVEHDRVARGLEHAVQRHGELDHAEVRPEVAAGAADRLDQEGPDLLGQGRQLVGGEPAERGGARDALQQAHVRPLGGGRGSRRTAPCHPILGGRPIAVPSEGAERVQVRCRRLPPRHSRGTYTCPRSARSTSWTAVLAAASRSCSASSTSRPSATTAGAGSRTGRRAARPGRSASRRPGPPQPRGQPHEQQRVAQQDGVAAVVRRAQVQQPRGGTALPAGRSRRRHLGRPAGRGVGGVHVPRMTGREAHRLDGDRLDRRQGRRQHQGERPQGLGAPAQPAGRVSTRPRVPGLPIRSTADRTGPSSSSPASASWPPTTTTSGLSTLHSCPTASPMACPASATTRRQPASPATARATICSASSAPCVGASRLSRWPLPATVSRQPRLPQRQIVPVSSTVTWPISPAVPCAPGRAAVEHETGPDPGGDLKVDRVPPSRAAPQATSPRAPTLASFSIRTGTSHACWKRARRSAPAHPGRIVSPRRGGCARPADRGRPPRRRGRAARACPAR